MCKRRDGKNTWPMYLMFLIRSLLSIAPVQVRIYYLTGRQVFSSTVPAPNQHPQTLFRFSGEARGMYLVETQSEFGVDHRQVVFH
ncbi:MAG: T9SS type A sorting domain-containing protein [Salibacteraceae bacterium]